MFVEITNKKKKNERAYNNKSYFSRVHALFLLCIVQSVSRRVRYFWTHATKLTLGQQEYNVKYNTKKTQIE